MPILLLRRPLPQKSVIVLGGGQYHHAVAGGSMISMPLLPMILDPYR